MELDAFDRRLLDALQQDSRRTGGQLAEIVGLSSAACLRRAQRLREAGVIEREVAIVAPASLGERVSVIVLVTLERDRPDVVDSFHRTMARADEVQQCYSITGTFDLALVVAVPDMNAYNDFIKRHLRDKPVHRFETMVVLERLKFTTAMPIADGT
jgi:Lrp/AsnC family transcriptional regulator, leucine-responsive regulatory protein